MTHWTDELVKSPGFCTFPFFHTYISQNGKANVCCNNLEYVYGNINEPSYQEVMSKNNPKLTDFRRQFINSKELPDSCQACKTPAGDNYRRDHINKTKHILKKFNSAEELINNEQIYTYDVRFNNLCNLECLYCNPHASTRFSAKLRRWGKDVEIFQSISASNISQVLTKFENSIEDAVEFYFAGGEPLIMKEHYDILDICLKHGRTDIHLAYSTNLTVLETKKYNALDYLKQFNHVGLNASIDAGWEQFEFIRHGGKWDDILENIKKVRPYKGNIAFTIAPVIAFWNIISFPKVYIYLVENNLLNRMKDFYGGEVLGKPYLRPGVLPEKFKDRVREIYATEYKNYPEIHYPLKYLDEDLTHLLPETKKEVLYLCRMQNVNFNSVFPELKGLFD
jgi:MoaA/NifB/PqqE/SkfB family radical SAM enzyme